jgi:YegS/Rv2252/BmrU family lipid kinase
MKKVAFIINPASGIGSKASLERHIAPFFKGQNGWSTEMVHTKEHQDALRAALCFKEEGFDLVVAVGGDGTVNQVASALVHSAIPMGIIPTGSGNGLARHLGIPLSVPRAVAMLQGNHVTTIDSGSLNGRPFFCTAGIGFDASLANRFNRATVRGFPSYMAMSALEYTRYQPEKYKIYVGAQLFECEAFLITFANCAQWGNNIYIAPEASVTDGLLDMVIWKKTPKTSTPFVAMHLITRSLDHSSHIEYLKGVSFRVERCQEGWAHVDGEDVQMGKELEVMVCPSSLQVVTSASE